jgi:hypothetical protein
MAKKKAAVSKGTDRFADRPGADQIAKWKEQYGKDSLTAITTEDDYMCIVRQPKALEIEDCIGKFKELAASKKASNQKVRNYDLQRIILPVIKVYEDKGMLEDADRMLYVLDKLDEAVKFVSGEVKKL